MKTKKVEPHLDVLVFSSTDWEGIWGSRQQVMSRLSERGFRILFVEQMAGLEHLLKYPRLFKRKRRRWREGIRQISKSLEIINPPPLLPGRYYSLTINKINSNLIRSWIQKYLLERKIINPILWLYKPEQFNLIGKFKEKLSIYHCIDEWKAGTSGRKRRIIKTMEDELLTGVDITFVNSKEKYLRTSKLNKNVYRIPSGTDVNLFAQVLSADCKTHPVIQGIKRPRICYMGNINDRLNYHYLQKLVTNRRNYSLVLIGDTYPWRKNEPHIKSLWRFPNVFFLGEFPFCELPSLLKGIDVCLIPFRSDERGFYRSPIKLYEYLSAGKPIVSSHIAEAEEFSEYVYIANSPEEFVLKIDRAIAEDNDEKRLERINISKIHSWDIRVNEMEHRIMELLAKQSITSENQKA